MEPREYMPFDDTQEFSDFLAKLFDYFSDSGTHSFTFEWLQNLGDVRVVCQDCTANPVDFPISRALQDAIEGCEYINSPRKNWLNTRSCDYHWAGYVESAVSKIAKKVEIPNMDLFGGPLFHKLYYGYFFDYHCIIHGYRVFKHLPDHWSCMMKDNSASFNLSQNSSRKDYLLRSELLAATSIFYRQMNTACRDPYGDGYNIKLREEQVPLTATIVTFCPGKVRVVQATCDPTDPLPTIMFRLMAMDVFTVKNYDKFTGHKALKWILSPPPWPKELVDRTIAGG